MGSRKAVLSAQRLLDMVPLGDDLTNKTQEKTMKKMKMEKKNKN